MRHCNASRLLVCGALLAGLLNITSCHRKNLDVPHATVQDMVVSVQMVQGLQSRLNPSHPGRGVTDYPGNTVEDVPKSYAMVLLGELARKKHASTASFLNLEALAGQWLLDHADENRDTVIGWGVPVAWDAYGDGSENPAHTEYSISTAIVMDALLTWREVVASPKADEIISLVEKAALPYLAREVWTPAGMLPYSLRESDRKYDTFNSAMYLAGQFQRLSTLTSNKALAARLRDAADSTVHAHVKQKKVSSETGAWYWYYSISESTPNDLPHAAYIVQGLSDYVTFGGRLSETIDLEAVSKHIEEFVPSTTSLKEPIRAWPQFRKDVSIEARSYDIGMALHIACTNKKLTHIQNRFVNSVSSYRSENGAYLKYPVGSSHNQLVVAEYESYLYRGLASCLAANVTASDLRQRPSAVSKIDHPNQGAIWATPAAIPNPRDDQEVAFVKLLSSHSAPRVLFSPSKNRAQLDFPNGKKIVLPSGTLPIDLLETGETTVVVLRGIPDGKLWLMPLNGDSRFEIIHASNRLPIYRAAAFFEGRIYLVYYDNPTSANWLLLFEHSNDAWHRVGQPMRLPSLQDPAGSTYEMIPRMEFVKSGDRMWITGGTLNAEILPNGAINEGRFLDCVRAIEVLPTNTGPIALCNSANPNLGRWILSGASSSTPLDSKNSIPWNLRIVDGRPQIDLARSDKDLALLLVRDLMRAQHSGWMEFGVNNEEGRIPWSQIYYLNGFLDIVKLARANPDIAKLFAPLIPLIKQRLALEMALIDQHWKAKRFLTRAFTVDRSPALFAVQSARLLLLYERYQTEIPGAVALPSYADVRSSVTHLRSHIEVIAYADTRSRWMDPNQPYLMWPKGSKFYFDGLNVPFNHQNEWAYSVIRAGLPDSPRRKDAQGVIRYFSQQVVPLGAFPETGEWNYWWGQAYDGWNDAQSISVNKSSYGGDKIKAWISFRTIDAMALLSTYGAAAGVKNEVLVESAVDLIREGKVYPFAAYELLRLGILALPNDATAHSYARVSSPWELQSAAWALATLSTNQNKTQR